MPLNLILLIDQLADYGYTASIENYYPFSRFELNKNPRFREEASRIYKELSGQSDEPPSFTIRPTVVINDKLFLEIDDHTHFNRYRMITFKSPIYDTLQGIDTEKYRRYCKMYEKECLKSGMKAGFWSSKESIQYFGAPAEPGDFFGNGSPGWKMKAFDDYMVDLFSVFNNYNIIRIPVYDNLLINNQLIRISKFCEGNVNPAPLIRYLQKKISGLSI